MASTITQIYNLSDLKNFRDSVNDGNDYSGKTVTLMADIELGSDAWKPIGYDGNTFNGTFNGNGYMISGLRLGQDGNFNRVPYGENTSTSLIGEDQALGLFGSVNDATIRNLMLYDVEILLPTQIRTQSDNQYTECVGALVGYAEGIVEIENCMIYDLTLEVLDHRGSQLVGGMVGVVSHKSGLDHSSSISIDNCAVKLTSTPSGLYVGSDDHAIFGGIVGCTYGRSNNSVQITNSYFYASYILMRPEYNSDCVMQFGGLLGKDYFYSIDTGRSRGGLVSLGLKNNFVYVGELDFHNASLNRYYGHPTFAGRSQNLFSNRIDYYSKDKELQMNNPLNFTGATYYQCSNNYVLGDFREYYSFESDYSSDRPTNSYNSNGPYTSNMRRYLFDNGENEIINLNALYATYFMNFDGLSGWAEAPEFYSRLGWFIQPYTTDNLINVSLNATSGTDKGSVYYLPCFSGVNIPILRIFCENVTMRNVDTSLGALYWRNTYDDQVKDYITKYGNYEEITVCLPRFASLNTVVGVANNDYSLASNAWKSNGTPSGVTLYYRPKRSTLSTQYLITNEYEIRDYDVDLPSPMSTSGSVTEGVDSYGNPTYEYWSDEIYSETYSQNKTTSNDFRYKLRVTTLRFSRYQYYNFHAPISYHQDGNSLYIYSSDTDYYLDGLPGDPVMRVEFVEMESKNSSQSGGGLYRFDGFLGYHYSIYQLDGKINLDMEIRTVFVEKEITVTLKYDWGNSLSCGQTTSEIKSLTFKANDADVELTPVLDGVVLRGFDITNLNYIGSLLLEIFKQWDNENVPWGYELDYDGVIHRVNPTDSASIPIGDVQQFIDIYILANARMYEIDLWTGTDAQSQPEEKSVLFTYLSEDIDLSNYAPGDITDSNGYEKVFGSWLIGFDGSTSKILDYKGNATQYQYKVDGNTLVVYSGELSNPDKQWLFALDEKNKTITTLNGKTYYVVTFLLTRSYGNSRVEDGEYPFVITKWSNTYQVNIDVTDTNSNSNIWNNLKNPTQYYGVGGVSRETGTDKPSVEVHSNNTSLSLYIICTNQSYNFPFMTSYGMSMYSRTNFTNNTNNVREILPTNSEGSYYYIFKYGYKITEYSIQFIYNGTTYYLTYNSDTATWSYTNTPTRISVTALSSADLNGMAEYAEYLDNIFAFGLPSGTVITMIPTWEAVDVQILQGSTSLWSGQFNEDYTASVTSPLGESLAYFTNGGERYIMPSSGDGDVRYNYYNLEYAYVAEEDVYEVSVTPVYVDNIYRVYLEGFKASGENTYTLINTDYGYVPVDRGHKTRYNHIDYEGYKSFGNAGYCFATEYANAMQIVVTNYVNSIEVGTHDLLRKVYTTGNIEGATVSTTGAIPSMYIFLANNQQTANLPIFETEYKTLIYWTNSTNSDMTIWAYTTLDYDAQEHGVPPYFTHTGVEQGIWKLADNFIPANATRDEQVIFTAYYFRKIYNLDITTQLNEVGQYGYVVIDIVDVSEDAGTVEDKSASYLILYLGGEMKYYDITGSKFTSLATIRISGLRTVDEIELYAGCDISIHVYDQSKDPNAMLTGVYTDMIGYKYIGTTSSLGDVLASTKYDYTVTAENIESAGLSTGSRIQLTAWYDYIEYEVSIAMSSGDATEGRFVVTYPNGAVSGLITSTTLSGLTVGDNLQISYRAYSGYEFAPDAFTLVVTNKQTGASVTVTLATYETLKQNSTQTYAFTLNGNWLLTNYYRPADRQFSVEDTNLGTIKVNTAEIEFDYYIRLIDYTTSEILEDRLIEGDRESLGEDNKWQLSDGPVSLSSVFTGTEGMGYVIEIGGKSYAAVYSYAYKPRQPNSTVDHYTTYTFLLTERPTRTYSISSDLLSDMTMSTVYEILADDLRQIYMVIVVGEIVEIDYSVEEVEHDPGLERTVTLTNGNENTSSLTVTSDYTRTNSIYTYIGLQNNISLTYNANAYTGAVYTYNDVEVTNRFSVTEGGELVIEFIPRAIPVRVETYINETQADISQIVDIQYIYADNLYYCTDPDHTDGIVTITFTQRNVDYDLSIYINGVLQTQEYTVGTASTIQYRVTSNDCALGEIYIRVVEEEHDNNSITVEYALVNTRLSTPTDEFGTYNILIDGEEITGDNITVYEGRRLELSLDLNTGYTYYGVMHNNGTIQQIALNGNILTISNSFTTNQGGRYRIYLEKTRLNAELRIEGETHKTYTIDTNQTNGDGIEKTINQDRSIIRLNNLYLGKTITLTRTQEDKNEQFNYYYYESEEGEVILEGNTIEITSELLESLNGDLIIHVSTTPKYRIELTIQTGERYINVDREQFYTNGDYVYYTSGTKITLEITSIEEGRYIISLTGDVEATGYSINEEIEITRDMRITISAEPRTYAVTVQEYLYNSIESIEEGAIAVETDPIEMSGQRYQESATLTIPVEKTDRRLYEIELTIYGISLKVNLETGEIESEEEYTYNNGILSIGGKEIAIEQGDRVTLRYITEGEVGLNIYYKSIKEIAPKG